MKVTTLGRKFNVTEDLKQKVELKLSKLDKFFGEEATANVTMRSQKNKEILEITITHKGRMFRSEVSDDTILNALDKSIDIIERQIRKNKTRLEKQLKSASFDAFDETIRDLEEEEIVITKTKKFVVDAMSAEEAVLQMNLLGHNFFLFRNADNGQINVAYKKGNGEYGLIEPID